MALDDELIRRATKSRSKTGGFQTRNQTTASNDAVKVGGSRPTTSQKSAKDISSMNEFGKLLNAHTKELMAKIDSN